MVGGAGCTALCGQPAQCGHFDLYLQPLDGGAAQLIWENDGPGFLEQATFAPGGERVAFIRSALSAEQEIIEVSRQSGERRLLNPPDRAAAFLDIAYSKDGAYLYALTNLDS